MGITIFQFLIAMLAAEGFMCLVRSKEIEVLVKRPYQRTKAEQQRMDRGLMRSVLLEAALFVPVSVALVVFLLAPLVFRIEALSNLAASAPEMELAIFGLIGLASFQFPFITVKRVVTRIALRTLTEFAKIASESEVGGR